MPGSWDVPKPLETMDLGDIRETGDLNVKQYVATRWNERLHDEKNGETKGSSGDVFNWGCQELGR